MHFLAHVCCGQTVGWGWIKMPLGMEVGLGPDHIVSDGTQLPGPKEKGAQQPPQFLAHVCCDQMAGWIKMPLGKKVGLGPGDIVLDEDPAPPKKGHTPNPNFRPMSVVAKRHGCIKMPLGMEVGLGPGDIVRWGTQPP